MERICILILLFVFNSGSSNPVSTTQSIIVSTTASTPLVKENVADNSTPLSSSVISVNPEIYSMQIQSNISNRFATTLISSKVRNLGNSSAETTFSVVLPENAFISAFEMEIDEKVYKAYVKEKEEAKRIYQEAVSRGQSAAHVELSARDSKTFTTSVNIEPHSKTIFRLTYEELLQRKVGQYELVINIHPGQLVKDLGVKVHVSESRPLTFIRTPSLRTGNEIGKNDEKLNPSADIQVINSTSAIVKFNPSIEDQTEFGKLLGSSKENGLAGQFVVQYDVERDSQGGEILVRDGYFVHFFAPSELKPLKKHVVFVLDHSGSMSGRKFEQLTEAMRHILSELKSDDVFNIVRFASKASVWDIEQNKFVEVRTVEPNLKNWENAFKEENLPEAVEANPENVDKAKNIGNDDMGLTNIMAGLQVGLYLLKRNRDKEPKKYQSMMVFLTDGLPNVGTSSPDLITETITQLNNNQASIFSLSFGTDGAKDFLRKLSSKNLGFSRHIYEASDASLQLQDFYRQISSPLLSNVTFKYVDGVTALTNIYHPIFFNGSEIVIAGRASNNDNILKRVVAICNSGQSEFKANQTESDSSLERLWAYLTVKDILKKRDTEGNGTELTKKALDLALKYSFVTSVSSLVVVKPNDTQPTDTLLPKEVQASAPVNGIVVPMYAMSPRRVQLSKSFYQPSRHLIRFGASGGGLYNSFRVPSLNNNHYAAYTTRRTPIPSNRTSTTPTSLIPPQWIVDLKNNNGNITTPQGTFKLGQSRDDVSRPLCFNTPLNSTGECTIIFDCPQVYSFLADVNVFLNYFCPLHEYVGVCCPKTPEP